MKNFAYGVLFAVGVLCILSSDWVGLILIACLTVINYAD